MIRYSDGEYFSRGDLCGDYRQINGYINIPQEPIPHVQQTLSKAAGWTAEMF